MHLREDLVLERDQVFLGREIRVANRRQGFHQGRRFVGSEHLLESLEELVTSALVDGHCRLLHLGQQGEVTACAKKIRRG
jgi:hypothetical protein